MAHHRDSRPKPAKLATNLALRVVLEQDLDKEVLPEQITGRHTAAWCDVLGFGLLISGTRKPHHARTNHSLHHQQAASGAFPCSACPAHVSNPRNHLT